MRLSDAIPASVDSEALWVRRAVLEAYAVLRERDPARQRKLIAADVRGLLGATVVRPFERDQQGKWRLLPVDDAYLPLLAERMESELLTRAVVQERSLLSTHPRLDPALERLAAACRARQITTHLLLVRATGETHGAYGVHWIDCERPPYEQRVGFYYYWDTIGIAVATAHERLRTEAEFVELRRRALSDRLTGLPNSLALEDELQRHVDTMPFAVLALDFDGMREANAEFGFTAGGDVLISVVGRGLSYLTHDDEFAARMHTAGDEFAVLLPGASEEEARVRASEIERSLDALTVPDTHREVYRGASVGYASRRDGESPGQVLGRAIEVMRERKLGRRHA